ncbi:MAG: radical SAM protein [Promethearchaeota archaeon]
MSFQRQLKNKSIYLTSYPIKVDLNTTNICNYRCIFCEIHYFYKYSERKSGKVSPNHINLDFIQKFNKLFNRTLDVELSGASGEPFINPFIIPVCKKLKDKLVTLSVTTNGSLLNKYIANELVKIGFDNILISIHSGDAKIYHQLQGGNFNEIINNLKNFTDIKKNRSLKLPKIKINCFLSTINARTIKNLLKILNEIGIKEINLYHYYASRNLIRQKVSFYFYPKDGNKILKCLYDYANSLNLTLTPKKPQYITETTTKIPKKKKLCKNPWNVLKFKGCVEHENSHYVTVCNRILLFRLNYVEFEGDFLKDVWNHEIIRYLRKNVLKNPICQFCRDPFTPKLRCINNKEYQIKRDIAVKNFFKEVFNTIKIKERKGIYLFNENPYKYNDYYESN